MRTGRIALWGALIVACAMQGIEIRRRGIDPDEFEHLHAAYMVYRGETPYRDFFEHHSPLLYYVAQPLFHIFGPDLAVLWSARCVMWLCSLGTLALVGRMAARWAGQTAGLAAASLLAWTSIFHSKGIEMRPDVAATLLLTAAVAAVLDGPASWRRWLATGIMAGLATLLTQKAIVPAGGLALAGSLRALFDGSPRRATVIPIAAMAIGGALAWGAALGAFAIAGAGGAFLDGTVMQLTRWPIRSHRWEHLRPTIAADLSLWVASAAEIVAVVAAFHRRETWQSGRGLVAVSATVCIASLEWVKATFPQYYLLWLPLLAVLAAHRLTVWCRAGTRPRLIRVACLVGLLSIGFQAALWLRVAKNPSTSALRHLSEDSGIAAGLAYGQLFAALACGAWLVLVLIGLSRTVYRGPTISTVVVVVAVLGMWHAVVRNFDAILWSNRRQVEIIQTLHRHVRPDETVLDGFTGYGALRPHAYYFWWINEYSLALMSEEERGPKLLELLQTAPPVAVLFDGNLDRLPECVTDWIRAHYWQQPCGLLWFRNPE